MESRSTHLDFYIPVYFGGPNSFTTRFVAIKNMAKTFGHEFNSRAHHGIFLFAFFAQALF
jgi:hypothetical protein